MDANATFCFSPPDNSMLENIKLTLDENHIAIPYQQITVHQAHMESEK